MYEVYTIKCATKIFLVYNNPWTWDSALSLKVSLGVTTINLSSSRLLLIFSAKENIETKDKKESNIKVH